MYIAADVADATVTAAIAEAAKAASAATITVKAAVADATRNRLQS